MRSPFLRRFLLPIVFLASLAAVSTGLALELAVQIPVEDRQCNFVGTEGTGLCVYASLEMLARHQGYEPLYGLVVQRSEHSGGCSPERLAAHVRREGWPVVQVQTSEDVLALIAAAHARRHGAAVSVDGNHVVVLVHLDAEQAGYLDPNCPGRVTWQTRALFLARLQVAPWAFTLEPSR